MNKNEKPIGGKCPLYVCACCRTKFGWKHQRWCSQKDVTEPDCSQCGYLQNGTSCKHPIRKKERRETLSGRYTDSI